MDRKFVIALSSLAGSVFLSEAYAVGLGEIRVRSNLNEPLRADIQLVQAKDLGEAQLLVNLASDSDFARAGVDRDFLLNSLRFRVDLDDPRNPRIVVTTQQPVREPFLNFLVELQWPSGRLLREYTVLMDLPAFAGTAPSAVSRPQAAPPVVQPIPYDEGVRAVERPARATPVAKPIAKPVASKPKAAAKPQATKTAVKSKPAPKATSVKHDGANYGPTKNNDTLWTIAKSLNNGGNVHQNMIAIQRMNPDAFINGNINKMKQGQVLALPGNDQIAQISKSEAVAEVQNHNTAWKTGKRPEQVVGAQINATDRAPDQQASTAKQDGQLKLATPSESKQGKAGQGGGDGQADVAKLQNDLAVSMEELNRHQRTRDEVGSRVQALDSQLENAEKLLSLQSNELAKLQGNAAEKQAAAEPATAPQTAVGEAGAVNDPAQTDAAKAQTVAAEEAAKAETLAKEEAAKAEQVAAEEAAKAEALAKEEAAKAEAVAAEEAATAEALAKEEAAKAEAVAAEEAAKAEALAKEEAAKAEAVAAEEAAKAEALAKEEAAKAQTAEQAAATEQPADANALVDATATPAVTDAATDAPATEVATETTATDAAAVAAAAQAEQQAQAEKAQADEAAKAEAAKAEQAAAQAKADAEKATDKAQAAKTQPAPVAAEKPIWQNWPVIGGAAALLLGLMAWRRRQVQKADEEAGAYEAPYTPAVVEEAPVAEAAVEEIAVVEEVVAAEPVVEEVLPETGDVLGEADIFISFGSYDKAAALLASAIAREPQRPDYRLKQLELFKEEGDLAAFDQANAELRNLNNDSANFKAAELRAMIPGAAAVAATYAASETDLATDLINEFTSDTQSIDEAADDIVAELDFDSDVDLLVTELTETEAAPLNLDDALELSFDTTSAPALDLDDLALDLSFDAPAAEIADDSANEIDLSFDAPAAELTDSVEAIALDNLGLDLGLDTDSVPSLVDTTEDTFLNFDDASLADASFTEADAASADLIAELNAEESLDVDALDLSDVGLNDAGLDDAGLDELALDNASAQDAVLEETSVELPVADLGLDDLGLDLDLGDSEALSGVAPSGDIDEDLNFLADADEAATKLDLARAYIDMGDSEGARDILGEVLDEGTSEQKADAQALIDSLG